MSYETWLNPPQCHYSAGPCGFPDDDVTCECCSGYKYVNCEKCKNHEYRKYGGSYCGKHGHSIKKLGAVCDDLVPNCLFCEHRTTEWRAGFPHYGCKLKLQGSTYFKVNFDCDQFAPDKFYKEWREGRSGKKQE